MSSEPGPASLAPRLDALEAAVRARSALTPRVALVLGSGLGGLTDTIADPVAIPFAELPGWPAASAPGHSGRPVDTPRRVSYLGLSQGIPSFRAAGRGYGCSLGVVEVVADRAAHRFPGHGRLMGAGLHTGNNRPGRLQESQKISVCGDQLLRGHA